MKKRFLLITLLVMMMCFLTGCSKDAKATGDFLELAGKYDLSVVDGMAHYSTYDFFEESHIAKSNKGWQIEFNVLKDNDSAKTTFETNKTLFEESKTEASIETSVNGSNYNKYGLTTGGYYMYISRIDNTFIYLRVEEKYKEEVKEIIKEFGY